MNKKENNLAFVDGQNLYMGTNSDIRPWKIDLVKFRRYLSQKYHVSKAYYFLGFVNEENNDLYKKITGVFFDYLENIKHKIELK